MSIKIGCSDICQISDQIKMPLIFTKKSELNFSLLSIEIFQESNSKFLPT